MLCNTSSRQVVTVLYEAVEMIHEKVSKINIKEYPCVIYTLAYQDGVIHAWERFLRNNTGDYNCPNYVIQSIRAYEKIIKDKIACGYYWDSSYYEGYMEGLTLIEVCEKAPELIKDFPFFFLPNAKRTLESYDIYLSELERVSKGRGKYMKYAMKIVQDKGGDLVVHHPPF